MKINIIESWSDNLNNIWTRSGGCYLDTLCKNCPFRDLAYTTPGGCIDLRLNIIQQLNITSYPYTLDATDLYPELFI